MKTRFTLFTFLLLSLTGLNAQTELTDAFAVPLKPQSPVFGKDIVINDSSSQNQRQVVVRSAFNGWLYAEYSAIDPVYNTPVSTVMKSVDNGLSWSVLINLVWPGPYKSFISTDMAVSGDSISNLKLFLAWVASVSSDPSADRGDAWISRFNGVTGDNDYGFIMDAGISCIALATDFMYPASNSNPHSLGILYSKYSASSDTIIFRSSSNGGTSFDYRQRIASSTDRIFKVALAYGRSQSYSSGRYFAAWEEKASLGSTIGHIYTAHTEPNFNSPFTTPVQLDALDPSDLNMCRNPTIACQYNNADNDSANLTEVVLFEKYKPASGDYDVMGYYNLQAATTSHFRPLNIAATANNEIQPDISFNPYNSKFMVTYFDSTDKKLPFLTNDVNLANPNSWNVVSQGYNDNSNLVAPYPKVELNFAQQNGINAWISEGTGGNGIALFDAPYSTYTGVSGNNSSTTAKLIGSYPNPCSNSIKIAFELKKTENVTIDVLGIMGQPLGTVTDQTYSAGKHTVQYDVSGLPSGSYLYTVRSGDFNAIGKFTVIR